VRNGRQPGPCSEVLARIHQHLDDGRDPRDSKSVQVHLPGCPPCSVALDELLALEKLAFDAFEGDTTRIWPQGLPTTADVPVPDSVTWGVWLTAELAALSAWLYLVGNQNALAWILEAPARGTSTLTTWVSQPRGLALPNPGLAMSWSGTQSAALSMFERTGSWIWDLVGGAQGFLSGGAGLCLDLWMVVSLMAVGVAASALIAREPAAAPVVGNFAD